MTLIKIGQLQQQITDTLLLSGTVTFIKWTCLHQHAHHHVITQDKDINTWYSLNK